jgi:hypothetical protein
MSGKSSYLRPMLDAGSARVFNCIEKYRAISSRGATDPYFFKHKPFHKVVILKEAATDRRDLAFGRSLRTKLYFPYDAADIYQGGRSIFLHEPKLLEVVNELVGLQGSTVSKDDVRSDLKMLQVMDGLPSLDAFLMRDALELEGFAPNPLYFEVSDAERAAIHDYIRKKFEPLVRAALGDATFQPSKVNSLVDKIWEARDLEALDPLIKACRFPQGDALKIFTAWKGINFYAFENERCGPIVQELADWLGAIAVPRFGQLGADADRMNFLKATALMRLKHHRKAVDDIVGEYDSVYTQFIQNPDAAGNFVRFLNRSREIYWRLGEALSALNHATHCWDASTASFPDRRPSPERLMQVFECLSSILAEERRGGNTSRANFHFV